MNHDDLERYRLHDAERVLTPALVIYPRVVAANIEATLDWLGGDARRWRPHVKTAKLGSIMRQLVDRGVTAVKCATTLELKTACEAGALDVLFAYPAVGAQVQRARTIAARFPQVRFAALVESEQHVAAWRGSAFHMFIDLNPGMNRTGIELTRRDAIEHLAGCIAQSGLELQGLHYYDGHLPGLDRPEAVELAHRGYDQLLDLAAHLARQGHRIVEVITAGTPALPWSLSHAGLRQGGFHHTVSPGTLVYCDARSICQVPRASRYRPAALVLSSVVSHPAPHLITCDAGHKSVAADAGIPTCRVLGRDDLEPRGPSEEHLPIELLGGGERPAIGTLLSLVPRHVCPTVNNFERALLVADGQIIGVEPVSARGREGPLL